MAKFLWKPVSDSDGKLVVLTDAGNDLSLVDLNTGQTIEQGTNKGASNGYGATVRFSQPGSAYSNVAVVNEAGQILSQISDGSGRIVEDVAPTSTVDDLVAALQGTAAQPKKYLQPY